MQWLNIRLLFIPKEEIELIYEVVIIKLKILKLLITALTQGKLKKFIQNVKLLHLHAVIVTLPFIGNYHT